MHKKDFPVFKKNPELVYLDSATSALTPQSVVDEISKYYTEYGVNVHRGMYKLSEDVSEFYENARVGVANFLNAQPEEIIFTSGTTHGLNLIANGLSKILTSKDNIVLSRLEHHANIIPWQQIAKRCGCEIRWIEINKKEYTVDIVSAEKNIDSNTKIVSFSTMSNVLGTITPAKKIIELAHSVGAIAIVDAAQSISHLPTDVVDLDCDFLVFSGHKLYGPTGIGVVFGKKNHLQNLAPLFYGGGMITNVTFEDAWFIKPPGKFEAGTPNIAGTLGIYAAVKYLQEIGLDVIHKQEADITKYALERLQDISWLSIIGPNNTENRGPVISFHIENLHAHDISYILGKSNIAVRGGHHCAMPLMVYLGVHGTTRASFGLYNSKTDVDELAEGIQKVIHIFS